MDGVTEWVIVLHIAVTRAPLAGRFRVEPDQLAGAALQIFHQVYAR